jgi:mannosyl-oligosaccharide alpha-1,2-mannosidase
MGAMGDSFYEYLLKYWLYENKSNEKILKTYLEAMKAIRKKLLVKTNSGYLYLAEYGGYEEVDTMMGHLTCFSGGLFSLTALYVDTLSERDKAEYENLALEITRTCHESYIRTDTRIGPESFGFVTDNEFLPIDRYYILRPEVIESYFYLWRMTKDNKYRDWAWEAAMAIEKHCKTDAGYSGLRDVRSVNSEKDDVQQSFFLAETLKYLYLIFSDDDVLPLDKFVFNTEAHPFPIRK